MYWLQFQTRVRLSSIEFGNRTHRKVPVRLCSITEPIEQQSERLGSIAKGTQRLFSENIRRRFEI